MSAGTGLMGKLKHWKSTRSLTAKKSKCALTADESVEKDEPREALKVDREDIVKGIAALLDSPALPKMNRRLSSCSVSSLELEFRDEGWWNKSASTVVLPEVYYRIPEDTNGTHIAQTAAQSMALIKSPSKAVSEMAKTVNPTTLPWKLVLAALLFHVESLSDVLIDRVNEAMQGRDIPLLLHTAQNLVPRGDISIVPAIRNLEQAFDNLRDDVKDGITALLERTRPKTNFTEPKLQGQQWLFAQWMGEKARAALVEIGIVKDWQLMQTRENVDWIMKMNQALADFFEQYYKQHSCWDLMSMTPKWIGIRERKVWNLALDTGAVDIERIGEVTFDIDIHLPVNVKLEEQVDGAKVADHVRECQQVEDGEWEDIEDNDGYISVAATDFDSDCDEMADSPQVGMRQKTYLDCVSPFNNPWSE